MILVTGATGMTGQFVVDALLRGGQDVRIYHRAGSPVPAFARAVESVVGDLGDPDALARAAEGVDGIIHSACTFTDSAVDVAAMRALVSAWRSGPFVFISSLDVYGFTAARPVDEDVPLTLTDDHTDYARGKVLCERVLADAAARLGRRDFVALRAPYIWGPHPKARSRLLPRRLVAHQPIVLPGASEAEWSQYRDVWIDVRDLATIVSLSLARPAGGPLNVLTGHFTWHELYAQLIELTGSRSQIVHKPLDEITDDELPRKQLYAQTWQFSEERLARHFGALPRRTFEVTLRDTVAG